MDKTYNGWTNWETWNIGLWLGNEEPLYLRALGFTKTHKGRITAEQAEAFTTDLMPNGTPDFNSPADYRRVDWNELAEFLTKLE